MLVCIDIFRPFRGFKSLRLIPREISAEEKVILCFADFENSFQTTLVINTLQGYRFDKDDILGLQFTYANKHGNSVNAHGSKIEGAKEPTPNNINNNSNANQAHVGNSSGADASNSAGKDAKISSGSEHGLLHGNNNTSKK